MTTYISDTNIIDKPQPDDIIYSLFTHPCCKSLSINEFISLVNRKLTEYGYDTYEPEDIAYTLFNMVTSPGKNQR